jgi:hypothetical protein
MLAEFVNWVHFKRRTSTLTPSGICPKEVCLMPQPPSLSVKPDDQLHPSTTISTNLKRLYPNSKRYAIKQKYMMSRLTLQQINDRETLETDPLRSSKSLVQDTTPPPITIAHSECLGRKLPPSHAGNPKELLDGLPPAYADYREEGIPGLSLAEIWNLFFCDDTNIFPAALRRSGCFGETQNKG